MSTLPFTVIQNDTEDWVIAYKGVLYAPTGDRSWTVKHGADLQALEMNTLWQMGYEAGAGYALGCMAEATKC